MDNTQHQESEEKRLSLGEHLEELRLRIIICIIGLIGCFFICWAFKSQILWVAKRPHSLTMESMGLSATLKVLSYQEGFFAYIKLCLISAFFLSYPMVLYQAWRFVSVGLYRHERHYVKMFLPFSVVGFLLGGLFGYFILIPLALQFLIRIDREPEPSPFLADKPILAEPVKHRGSSDQIPPHEIALGL